MESSNFVIRRVHDTRLLGCFMAPRLKRMAPGSPDSSSDSSSSSEKDDFFSSSDDPDVRNPLFTTQNSTDRFTKFAKPTVTPLPVDATEESFVFSAPAPSDAVLESPSFRTLSDPLLSTFSYLPLEAASSKTSFGGRPQPLPPPKPVWLPLPAPVSDSSSSLSEQCGVGSWSIRRGKAAAPVVALPLPPPSVATQLLPGLEAYEFEDLLQGTREFAPECCMEKGAFGAVYRACVKTSSQLGKELAVVRLNVNENQTLKDWKRDVQLLAQLPDANICLIKGYCAHEDVDVQSVKITSQRFLVFEQSPNGTLHDYLCGSRSKTQLDWSARISIVLGAARGLTHLHDRAPLQIVYREFKGSSVLLDKDYTPRLAGYGLVVMSTTTDRKSSSLSSVMKTSQAHARSNVWSFGIVLIELLTGKYSLDTAFLCNERSFVKWAKPFLRDESKLVQILDPRLKSKCPLQGAWKLAELALQCLKKKEMQRPSMSRVVEALKSIKEDFGGRQVSRRATFGGLSFRDLDRGTSGRSSSASDDSVAHLCTCALQSSKIVENAKAHSYRVF